MSEAGRHTTPITLVGPPREPRQMLADQSYAGHSSIHDDDTAAALGFSAAPIEGPTHFSQFAPLLTSLWGARWFEAGCISAHYQQVVVDGEAVRAFVDVPYDGAESVTIRAEKVDGSPVLSGTASVGTGGEPTECEQRLARAQPPERPVILDRLRVGQRGPGPERVAWGTTTTAASCTRSRSPRSSGASRSRCPGTRGDGATGAPWGRPVLPAEMVSVLATKTSGGSGFEIRQPSVGLFLDQEIRVLDGPLFVDEEYDLEREIVALGSSRRTESFWTRTTLSRPAGGEPVAVMLLHQGVLKESYPGYPT